MTFSYNCDTKLLQVCGIDKEASKGASIEMSTTSLCCESPELTTYYSTDYCSEKTIVDSIVFNNYQYSSDYNPNICTGWFSFHWFLSIITTSDIVSVNGTQTVTSYGGQSTTIPINSLNQLEGDLQYYLNGIGELFEFDLNFITAQGCEINVTVSFTTICDQCQCGVDLPNDGPVTSTVVDNPNNTFEYVKDRESYCALFDIDLPNGINSIHFILDVNDIYTCLFIDCGSELECKITDKIANNMLCASCGENINESFELFLQYQMMLSLLGCEKCCQACKLYSQLDDELSKCKHC